MNRLTGSPRRFDHRYPKGDHHYVLLYTDEPASRGQALRQLGTWASDPAMNFDWYDAARWSQEIRTMVG